MTTNNAQLSPVSQQLSFAQIEQLWINNGGDPNAAPLMAAIAWAESGGNTQAINSNAATGDYSVGLWQINYFENLGPSRTARYGSPTALTQNPNLQAKAAIDLYGGGAGIGNWTNDAAWKQWVAAGKPAHVTEAQAMQWVGVTNAGSTAPVTTAQQDLSVGGVVGTALNPGGAIAGTLGSWLGIPSINWTIIGGMALAIGLVLAGIYIMFHTQINSAVGGAVKDAGKAGGEAALA